MLLICTWYLIMYSTVVYSSLVPVRMRQPQQHICQSPSQQQTVSAIPASRHFQRLGGAWLAFPGLFLAGRLSWSFLALLLLSGPLGSLGSLLALSWPSLGIQLLGDRTGQVYRLNTHGYKSILIYLLPTTYIRQVPSVHVPPRPPLRRRCGSLGSDRTAGFFRRSGRLGLAWLAFGVSCVCVCMVWWCVSGPANGRYRAAAMPCAAFGLCCCSYMGGWI